MVEKTERRMTPEMAGWGDRRCLHIYPYIHPSDLPIYSLQLTFTCNFCHDFPLLVNLKGDTDIEGDIVYIIVINNLICHK